MIIYRRTSILESPAQTLVNTVNCVGVMGKGLAHAFKIREPKMYDRYREICTRKELEPGKLWLWRGNQSWVLNFPTKRHWRHPSKIEWVEAGLQKFGDAYEDLNIREVSFPRLGCGNGNLDWNEVRPLMEKYLSRVRIPVFIHDFEKDIGIPEHLETIADIAGRHIPSGVEFGAFVKGLRAITQVGADKLFDIATSEPFHAHVDEFETLVVETRHARWEFDAEDLHGAWVALLRGLVTRDRVQWSTGGGGDCLITLLSLLPNTRPVEIQRGTQPEIAVELVPWARQTDTTDPASEQLKLQWH